MSMCKGKAAPKWGEHNLTGYGIELIRRFLCSQLGFVKGIERSHGTGSAYWRDDARQAARGVKVSERDVNPVDSVYAGAAWRGLMNAFMEYDPSRGKFETFAFNCMRNQVVSDFRSDDQRQAWLCGLVAWDKYSPKYGNKLGSARARPVEGSDGKIHNPRWLCRREGDFDEFYLNTQAEAEAWLWSLPGVAKVSKKYASNARVEDVSPDWDRKPGADRGGVEKGYERLWLHYASQGDGAPKERKPPKRRGSTFYCPWRLGWPPVQHIPDLGNWNLRVWFGHPTHHRHDPMCDVARVRTPRRDRLSRAEVALADLESLLSESDMEAARLYMDGLTWPVIADEVGDDNHDALRKRVARAIAVVKGDVAEPEKKVNKTHAKRPHLAESDRIRLEVGEGRGNTKSNAGRLLMSDRPERRGSAPPSLSFAHNSAVSRTA